MNIYIITPITIIVILIIFSALQNLFYNEQIKKIKQFVLENNLNTINTNNAYYSALGLKKNYPSYPTKIFLTVTKKDLIIFGVNNFPFVFKTYTSPFAISLSPDSLQQKLKLNRIFKLDYISIKNRTIDLKFIDINGLNTKIDYQINFNNEIENDTIENLKIIEREFNQK